MAAGREPNAARVIRACTGSCQAHASGAESKAQAAVCWSLVMPAVRIAAMKMTRRTALELVGAGTAAAMPLQIARVAGGHIKQSVARWCYSKFSVEDLAKESARIGLKGMDLIEP